MSLNCVHNRKEGGAREPTTDIEMWKSGRARAGWEAKEDHYYFVKILNTDRQNGKFIYSMLEQEEMRIEIGLHANGEITKLNRSSAKWYMSAILCQHSCVAAEHTYERDARVQPSPELECRLRSCRVAQSK